MKAEIKNLVLQMNEKGVGYKKISGTFIADSNNRVHEKTTTIAFVFHLAIQSPMLMIWTGQRSAASRAQDSSSAAGVPSAIFPSSRNFSMTRLNESSGSCSKKPGHASQQEPQLTQVDRSIVTFIVCRSP